MREEKWSKRKARKAGKKWEGDGKYRCKEE